MTSGLSIQLGESYKTRKGIRAFVSYMVECETSYKYVGHTVDDYGQLTSVLWNVKGLADPRCGEESTITGVWNDNSAYLYTVYRNPRDFPGKYVIRKWVVNSKGNGSIKPTAVFTIGNSLKEVREKLLKTFPFLVKTAPMGEEDPCIVETWL